MDSYSVVWYFLIYGFLGWVVEVCFHALAQGKLVNRGFLNGAICPIYGFGVVLVVWILEPVASHGILLFAGATVLCSVLEWITGFILAKAFHQRWWDYTDEPLNIGGYICLRFSLMWGLACVFVVKLIHPSIQWLLDLVPETLGLILMSIFLLGLLVDVAATINTIMGLNKKLKRIEEAAAAIRHLSDELTEQLYEGAIKAKEEIEEEKLTLSQKRILKAFPKAKSTKHLGAMEKLRKRL